MDKFHKKLPREELKKFAREINKKLVASDYKNNRVVDPTSITPRQEKNIRVYVTDFFHRAVKKFQEREKTKAERAARRAARDSKDQNPEAAGPSIETPSQDEIGGIDEAAMSEAEDTISPSSSMAELKRKRDEDNELESTGQLTPSETPSAKRLKEDDADVPSPPPPPPPPPADAIDAPMTEEERSMREQEEALMRENEEAQRLEDEAEASKMEADGSALTRGDDETAQVLESESKQLNGQRFEANNGLGDYPANGVGNGSDLDGHGSAGEGSSSLDHGKARKQEVLSH
jgi:histone-lysine N-methyltransferase SETD2